MVRLSARSSLPSETRVEAERAGQVDVRVVRGLAGGDAAEHRFDAPARRLQVGPARQQLEPEPRRQAWRRRPCTRPARQLRQVVGAGAHQRAQRFAFARRPGRRSAAACSLDGAEVAFGAALFVDVGQAVRDARRLVGDDVALQRRHAPARCRGRAHSSCSRK